MKFNGEKIKVYIDLQRGEELAEDTEFKRVKFIDKRYTVSKGEVVRARYQAVVAADIPKGVSYAATAGYTHRVYNVVSALIMLHGSKVADEKFLQEQLKELLPEIPCELTEMTREYYTYTRTGRGGRYDFSTEAEDLLSETKNAEI